MSNLAAKIQRGLQRKLAARGANQADITVNFTSGESAVDLNDQRPTRTAAQTMVLRGLIHFVTMPEILGRGLTEIRMGDCIVDFDPTVSFAGKTNLSFTVNGLTYVQKTAGKDVERFSTVMVGNQPMFYTVILTRMSQPNTKV